MKTTPHGHLNRGGVRRLCRAVACLGLLPGAVNWAKGPEKAVTIALEELGQQAMGGRPQAPGATLATVNFVGDHHVLVTFPVRRLMKRLEDSQADDDDRLIEAVLVDVPSGKAAARTTWRVHDGGQYLWNLGHGRFALRVRDRLETVAPLENLSTEHPFEEHRLLSFDRRILGILVSAEGNLLTVETAERQPTEKGIAKTGAAGAGSATPSIRRQQGPVEISMYRLERIEDGVRAVSAGKLLAPEAIEVPMTEEGYLDISQESRGRWLFDYIAHAGKKMELSPFETSCYPRAKFVSRSEFVAIGCRGSADRLEIGGFDLRGQEMWQQNFFDSFVHPTFSFAPEAGRFALGRAITSVQASTLNGAEPAGDQMTGQDVLVMQMHTGKQLLHVVLTPVQRLGQNFALSQDGSELAVIQGTTVQIFRLPPLSAKDHDEVKGEREMALERFSGPILLPTRTKPVQVAGVSGKAHEAGREAAAPEAVIAKAPGQAVVAKPLEKPVEQPVNVGDAQPVDGPRKAPTLYAPTEKAEPVEIPQPH